MWLTKTQKIEHKSTKIAREKVKKKRRKKKVREKRGNTQHQ
jgi:hypothetical protein